MKTLASLFILCCSAVNAQVTFQKWYGGTIGSDYAQSAAEVPAGGYAVAVTTDSASGSNMDMLLIRTDANGNEVWRRLFGSSGWDIATGVIATNDGGFALCGLWNGLGADSATLIKTDMNGNLQWQQVFSPSSGRTVAEDLVELSDGSIVVTGFYGPTSLSNGFLVKYSSSGSLIWQKGYGGNGSDELISIAEVNGSGFILGGHSDSGNTSSRDYWLVRTDVNGDTLWTHRYGTGLNEDGYDVVCTQDGGFAIVGYEYVGGGDVKLLKTNSSGAQQWVQFYDGGGWESAYSLTETWDGGFAIAGRKENPSNNNQMWLIRTDSYGVFMWDRTYPSGYMSEGDDIHETSDGGFIIAGSNNNLSGDPGQAYFVKTENAGWLSTDEIKTASDFTVAQDVTNQTMSFIFSSAVPGRKIRIVDAEGRVVSDEEGNGEQTNISTGMWAKGIYVYTVYQDGVGMKSGKFVIP